jgi:hypothetical protein
MGHPASTLISKNQFIFEMNQLVVFDRYMKTAAWIRSLDETGYGHKRLSAGALNDDRFDLDPLFEELGIVGLKGFRAFEPKNSDQETIMDVIRPKIIRKLVNNAEWDRQERSGLLPVSPSQSRSPSPQPLPQVSLEVNEASPKQRSSRKVMLSSKHPPGDSPPSEQHYKSSSRAQDLESSNTSITNPPGGWEDEDEDEEVLENIYPI